MVVAMLAAFVVTNAHGASSAPARTGYIVETTTPLMREVIIRGECRRGTPVYRVYRRSLSGFAARLTSTDLRRLRRRAGVVRVVRDSSLRGTGRRGGISIRT
jgi:hypothetical protein